MCSHPNIIAFVRINLGFGYGRLCVKHKGYFRKPLQEADQEERRFIVRELHMTCISRALRKVNDMFTCWPRQMRGPALKGRNMKLLVVRRFTRSSKKRSGSKSKTISRVDERQIQKVKVGHTIGAPKIFSSVHIDHGVVTADAGGNVDGLLTGILAWNHCRLDRSTPVERSGGDLSVMTTIEAKKLTRVARVEELH